MIQIDPAVYFWLAGLFLFLPMDWVLSAITAALLHEFCHMAVLCFFGGKIQKIRIATGGCLIESSPNGKWQAMLCILAGPMGSLSLVFFRSFIPKIAVCGLIQGAYNLLPLLPLDGGHALQILLYSLCPAKADGILLWTGRVVCLLLFFRCFVAASRKNSSPDKYNLDYSFASKKNTLQTVGNRGTMVITFFMR